MTLKFSPGNHQYWMDKKRVRGVTSLIKKGLPSEALMYWSARTVAEWVADNPGLVDRMADMGGRGPLVAFLKETPWQKRDEAGVRGTEVHSLGQRLVHGEEIEVPEHLAPWVNGYCDFLDLTGLEPVLTEKSCANREHWYAGRFDLVGDIDGVRWMLDLKTAKGVYGDNALQLDAYRHAEFYVDDEDPDTEYPMPEGIERLGVIHIRPDGTDLVPIESNGEPFRDFLHCAWIAKRRDQIDGYVGRPITFEGAA